MELGLDAWMGTADPPCLSVPGTSPSVRQLLAPKCCCLLVLPREGESGAHWRMLTVRWVLLALPITQSWLDHGESTKEQSEPPGVALIPSFAWIPPKDPSSGCTHLWLLS